MLRQCQFIQLGAFAATLCILLAGCGGPDHELVLAPVSGTVTYNGEPLADAMVAFDPEEGGRIASGKTDEDGRYRLTTVEGYDGAIVGRHGVTVVKVAPTPAPHISDPDAGKPLIPEKYFDASTSELTAEVVEGENNVFDFELHD
jgi:hypothetical protein